MDLVVARNELARAHSALVEAFAGYPLRGSAAGCPCCVSAADHAELRSGNLRRYAFKAMTTWGNEADFKHFLPVLLTALTPDSTYYPGTVHDGACDIQCFTNKLAYARWQSWPTTEQYAVVDCLQTWWLVCLALVQQEFVEFLAGRSAAGWGNSAGPTYQELVRSDLLATAWLQEAWYDAIQPLPNQSSSAYVQSPAFLALVDWLHHFHYLAGAEPSIIRRTPIILQYLEEGFFYYSSLSPELAHRLSDLLYHLAHTIPRPTSGTE